MIRPGAAPTALFHLYRGLATLISPLAYQVVARKLRRHQVSPRRLHERLGNASATRPVGNLIWFHAASVGESLSVLTLIARMGERLPKAEFLITSGTATSAALIAKRMPPRTRHQFAPLDAPGPVKRFYDHWRPNAGIFVESELWPLTLTEGQARGVPLALLNARLSAKTVRGWQKAPETARYVLDQFDLMLTQNDEISARLLTIGADPARLRTGTNLKATSAPLPVDVDTLTRLRADLNGRPVWVASSTHPDEEEVVLDAHKRLLIDRPDLLLLLVPRHPERGDAVADLVTQAGMTMARRTSQDRITPQAQVYLADTLGETGTWYALTPLVFLGGSLLPIGGHNPYEVAQAGATVLTGPHVSNFTETFAPLIASGGAVEIRNAAELAAAIDHLLRDPADLKAACAAATAFVGQQQSKLDGVIDSLCDGLGLTPDG
ncbi:3-deoxy-D-manno-octulosonic acid transferase [Sedimentitalea nanhaiensis]|uniref:3-deoxy-D-manno-octulosonic acid transferase n=1 Tax=Sedimentitalea nanhaiensis TaxID=999627 RepID=A0A1I6ZNF6_9RHOB|nr:3-deoxy-D-manno-octulosonic acid transferase [Sedimentitalea nanhaiensis]SFT64170.1 3-deoxy-D-manno-octulosonic-acid transferase [Sedimentitalea nanhaiensis]